MKVEEPQPEQVKSPSQMTEEEKEQLREQGKWVNYPKVDKRPEDEFFDLTTINPIREEVVTEDGGIVKYV